VQRVGLRVQGTFSVTAATRGWTEWEPFIQLLRVQQPQHLAGELTDASSDQDRGHSYAPSGGQPLPVLSKRQPESEHGPGGRFSTRTSTASVGALGEEVSDYLLTVGPWAEAGLGVDMAGVAEVHEPRAPLFGQQAGPTDLCPEVSTAGR
jgi:hypothetical protein